MTEERLKNLIINFCYKVVNEDMEDRRGYKEPATPKTPVPSVNNDNNITSYKEDGIKAVIDDTEFKYNSKNDPMQVLVFKLENGRKVFGNLTLTEGARWPVYYKFLKPLGLNDLKNLQDRKNYNYSLLIGSEVLIELQANKQFSSTVEKIIKVISKPEDNKNLFLDWDATIDD